MSTVANPPIPQPKPSLSSNDSFFGGLLGGVRDVLFTGLEFQNAKTEAEVRQALARQEQAKAASLMQQAGSGSGASPQAQPTEGALPQSVTQAGFTNPWMLGALAAAVGVGFLVSRL